MTTVPESVTFTFSTDRLYPALVDWNLPKIVKVTAQSMGTATISHTVSSSDADYNNLGANVGRITVNVEDYRLQLPRNVVVTGAENLETSEDGETATFQMRLATEPTAAVTVTPAARTPAKAPSPVPSSLPRATGTLPRTSP